jgi:hypothetical protein
VSDRSRLVAAADSARDDLAVETSRRRRSLLWWRISAAYGWSIVARELAASPRWTPRTKAKAGVLAGIAISFPVTFGLGIPYLYWVLTGRGPWKRYGFSAAVVVNPFKGRIPSEVRAALADLHHEPMATAIRHPPLEDA